MLGRLRLLSMLMSVQTPGGVGMLLLGLVMGMVMVGSLTGAVEDEVAGVKRHRFERELMGTRFMVVCYAVEEKVAREGAEAALDLAERVNAVASDYLPESELSRLSSQPVGMPIPVSPLLYDVLAHARRMAEATDGACDPTLGPLTRLWREARRNRRLPAEELLQGALARTGWRHYTLDAEARTITLHRAGMVFDLGGVAKGHVADLMLETLAQRGLRRAMVVAGGDIRLGDAPPEREGWRIALQTFDLGRPDEVVVLANAAVSTSGDLHQWVELDGVRYSHILSPRTGLGLTRRVAAIVVASEANVSDAVATAACVLGPDAGVKLRQVPGVRDVKWRTPQESEAMARENLPVKIKPPHEKQP